MKPIATRLAPLLLAALVALSAGACASAPKKTWDPGDTVICPNCGREFRLPEKLGK